MRKWPNTLEAQRVSKETAYHDRLKLQESIRLKIDEEEELRRLEDRRKSIERANSLIENASDKMKSHKGRMMLSDTLKERQMQVTIYTNTLLYMIYTLCITIICLYSDSK